MNRASVEKTVLGENNRIAAELREALTATGALALNFISSPGAGKTMLLEKTLAMLPAHTRAAVVSGDIRTDSDAQRLMRYGYPVKNIHTAGASHLDARMIERNLNHWLPQGLQLLLIENAGDMACPPSFDLGEDAKAVILSVADVAEMPLEHPGVLRNAELLIVNKIDLLTDPSYKVQAACESARRINPEIEIMETSCTTGAGLREWMRWLEARAAKKAAALLAPATEIHGNSNNQEVGNAQFDKRERRAHQ